MAITDRTKWKKDEELAEQEKPKTAEELNIAADRIRNAIRMLNNVLEETSHYGMEVIIMHTQKRNEKAKINYDEYEVKRVYKKEDF